MEDKDQNMNNEERFAKAVRAGKRTYFFDVKTTRSGESYLTITESKKRFDKKTGKFFYQKHKIFLYREDFEKFDSGLKEAFDYIQTGEFPQSYLEEKEEAEKRKREREFTNIDFEDLDSESPDSGENT